MLRAALLALLPCASLAAEPAAYPEEPHLQIAILPPELVASSDAQLRARWTEGLRLEAGDALLESAAHYEALAADLPTSSFVRWRLSRNYWRHAETLPVEDKAGRLVHFRTSDRWASEALEIDPECGECVLWKLAALGRIATTGGVMESMSQAQPIAEMIDRGIALRPTHSDGPRNHSLGNLYYAGSAFYRIVPDWFWVPWVLGVRGDKHRALDYIQRALAITDDRVDYTVELGAVLLCIGHQEGDEARLAEGRRAMARAREIADFRSTDALDIEHAGIMLEQPDRACGYSRDGWIDLDEATASAAAGSPRGPASVGAGASE